MTEEELAHYEILAAKAKKSIDLQEYHKAEWFLLVSVENAPAIIAALREAWRERDSYKATCKRVGVCMTCIDGAPESYGCTDCLNTGWEQGAPIEARQVVAERDAALAEAAKLREALTPIVDEFSGTIEQYYKIGPDFTHKDGTEVFTVQTVLDREPLIVAARAALEPPQPTEQELK